MSVRTWLSSVAILCLVLVIYEIILLIKYKRARKKNFSNMLNETIKNSNKNLINKEKDIENIKTKVVSILSYKEKINIIVLIIGIVGMFLFSTLSFLYA
ncbi:MULTISPECIES: hypothetical protein [Spiroplasma]|uniref:Uncharacterized protein n=4 Tax=Spiroplasma TaxID=2132 RepID=A0AAJ4JXX1_SPICI|nr:MULTISPECIES: hypothetical protein [Spiroplasma]APE74444.1 hypothetical protein SCITRI_00545 [Spiroplasma citri]ELL44222.1 hypothetical protein SMIPMB4A_v3c8530 [Spiroplasma melliferum IPMB4A]KAI92259.1 hypothetical protein SPM_005915 [Spiroplasma melliferum KC3]QCO23683.1 hypothetical protein SRED_002154 [Spiroplasma melliferum]QED24369.1 hypothetical protein FRX96_02545 [Spiroplasma citri]